MQLQVTGLQQQKKNLVQFDSPVMGPWQPTSGLRLQGGITATQLRSNTLSAPFTVHLPAPDTICVT